MFELFIVVLTEIIGFESLHIWSWPMTLGLYTPLTLWETVVCSIPSYGAVCLV